MEKTPRNLTLNGFYCLESVANHLSLVLPGKEFQNKALNKQMTTITTGMG